jgi:hypothetical protein
MRSLFRSALAMIGCNQSGSPAPEGGSDQGPADAPHQAAFRVPGMS